jgi:hypothetical protein
VFLSGVSRQTPLREVGGQKPEIALECLFPYLFGSGWYRSGMAQPVFPPGHAARKENREGRHGPEAGGSSVLDVAQGMGLRAIQEVRFARGQARTRPWCAVKHQVIDWASCITEKFEVVIMIGRCRPKRCMGRTECPDLSGLRATLVGTAKAKPSTRPKWRSSRGAGHGVLEKGLTPPTSETRCYNTNLLSCGLRYCPTSSRTGKCRVYSVPLVYSRA